MAILTGLEIDSAKSGIRPDLDEYLTHKTVKRSDFLKYKTLVEEMETRRAWYEPTHATKVKAFFKKGGLEQGGLQCGASAVFGTAAEKEHAAHQGKACQG